MIRASGGIFVCKEERRRKRSDQRKSERERERERQYGVSGYEYLDERIDYLQVSNASSWLTALFCSRCYFFFTCEIKPTRPEGFVFAFALRQLLSLDTNFRAKSLQGPGVYSHSRSSAQRSSIRKCGACLGAQTLCKQLVLSQ